MHMISKKDLSDAEMDTVTKSCSPTIVVNTIHPAPEIHEHFMIQKATEHCAQPQAHFHLH